MVQLLEDNIKEKGIYKTTLSIFSVNIFGASPILLMGHGQLSKYKNKL
jgi:hypothetical protein